MSIITTSSSVSTGFNGTSEFNWDRTIIGDLEHGVKGNVWKGSTSSEEGKLLFKRTEDVAAFLKTTNASVNPSISAGLTDAVAFFMGNSAWSSCCLRSINSRNESCDDEKLWTLEIVAGGGGVELFCSLVALRLDVDNSTLASWKGDCEDGGAQPLPSTFDTTELWTWLQRPTPSSAGRALPWLLPTAVKLSEMAYSSKSSPGGNNSCGQLEPVPLKGHDVTQQFGGLRWCCQDNTEHKISVQYLKICNYELTVHRQFPDSCE